MTSIGVKIFLDTSPVKVKHKSKEATPVMRIFLFIISNNLETYAIKADTFEAQFF